MLFRVLRFAALFLIVAAAWFAWWIYSQQPISEMRISISAGQELTWTPPQLNQERTLLVTEGPARLFDVNFANGQYAEFGDTDRMDGWAVGWRAGWLAWRDSELLMHVARTGGDKSQRTIPAELTGTAIRRDLHGTSNDDQLLLVTTVDILPIAEIWDMKNLTVRRRFEGVIAKHHSLAISSDGSKVAAFTDSNTVRVWEINSGYELATLAAPHTEPTLVCFAPDGRLLVVQLKAFTVGSSSSVINTPGVSARTDGKTPADVVLWSADYTHKDAEFQLLARDGISPASFSDDGRYLAFSTFHTDKLVWDLGTQPATCLDPHLRPDDADNSFHGIQRIDRTGHRIVCTNEMCIRLYELPTMNAIEIEKPNEALAPDFSPSGRWIIAYELRSSKIDPFWKTQLRKYLPSSWLKNTDVTCLIWDANTGHFQQSVPGKQPLAWTRDESAVWMESNRSSQSASKKIFELYSVTPRGPAWWLYALTALALVTILWDIHRTWRRRHSASVAA
ncbi:MAG: WD40 repeat domain-containing protein [Gemmataceae bacterium]